MTHPSPTDPRRHSPAPDLPPRRGRRGPARPPRFRFGWERFEERALLSTFTVTNTLDNGDNVNPMPGSLRAAILATDADTDPNGAVINFNLPWADPGHDYYKDDGSAGSVSRANVAPVPTTAVDGVTPITSDAQLASPSLVGAGATIDPDWAHSWYTFHLTALLPALTNQVAVCGYSQPGSSPNDLAQGDDAIIKVELDGSGITSVGDGLALDGAGSSLSGLAVNRFASSGWDIGAINVGPGSAATGCFVGTDVSGTVALANATGIVPFHGSLVGGVTPAARNVISGNVTGIFVNQSNTTIQGNFLGSDASGTRALGNTSNAIVGFGTDSGTIGGTAPGAGNVISANQEGMYLAACSNFVIQGNLIGTDATGTHDLGNGEDAYHFEAVYIGGDNNLVGGTTPAARNVIAGPNGIVIAGGGGEASGNVVEGNYIGTGITGEDALGGGGFGVLVTGGASNNTIGGTAPGAGNVVSGGWDIGVYFSTHGGGGALPSGNLVEGNLIGLDATGTRSLGNYYGIGASEGANTIGGTAPGAANVISGNFSSGLAIGERAGYEGSDPGGTIVEGNLIGTDRTGRRAVPNGTGVWVVHNGSNVVIGGTAQGAGNVISGNTNFGLQFWYNSDNDIVQGNLIGTDATGTQPLGNGGGIQIDSGSSNDTIGGTAAGAANVIANSTALPGVIVAYSGDPTQPVTGDSLRGNSIYGNAGLGIDFNGDGVTPNDSHAGQPGPNDWQNFPVVTSAYAGPSSILIGTFHSTPGTTFTLDFYANAAADPSGYGEGQRWLGSATVTTDGSGNASFSATGLAASAPGEWISATATGPSGTSEFSQDVKAVPLPPSSLSGIVFADFNDDGQVDFGEQGIAGVTISLDGTDFLGHPVHLSQPTDGSGAYVYQNLLPGTYTITEAQQPSGYTPGINNVGTGGGTVSGAQFTSIVLAAGEDAMNYNYGEVPAAAGAIHSGLAAGIGFWNNKNGQALIESLNGGAGHQLGDWLAATFPHMFGAQAGSNDLAGQTNAYVASFFQGKFVVHGQKLDAQVLATALAVYVTDPTLDSTRVGAQYGFLVSGTGLATTTCSVGSNGAAFGVADNTTITVLGILKAADEQALNGFLYNGDVTRRNQANTVFSTVNEAGSI